ncbi:hypothetical protein HanIR_Chr11g0547851 [Helianthus annuus]|nr:hypothetical protein HanIR_Chr11g0547851 [Helianthus annuus]
MAFEFAINSFPIQNDIFSSKDVSPLHLFSTFISCIFSQYSTCLTLIMSFSDDNYFFGGDLTSESNQVTYELNQDNNLGLFELNQICSI